jgi:hypothetical protein
MTTYANFVTNLGDLSISTVKREYDEPPLSLNTSDLPAQWVQIPVGEEGPITFASHGGYPTLSAQLVVAFEAAGQSTQPDNWSGTVALMDTVATALRGAVKTIVRGQLTWIISLGQILVADVSYWAVIAEVTGHG